MTNGALAPGHRFVPVLYALKLLDTALCLAGLEEKNILTLQV